MNIILYFSICVFVRLSLAISSKNLSFKKFPYLLLITIPISLGFFYQFFRKNRRMIGAFNNKVWWHHLRIIHAINYLLFSILYILNNNNAWLFLLADVLIGVFFFIANFFNI